MKDLSFYEQAGIVIPGAVVLFGLLLLVPGFQPLFAKDGLTVGGLGLFLLIAYAAGHLVAGIANIFEAIIWWPVGGMPSNWVRRRHPRLFVERETDAVSAKLCARHGRITANVLDLSRAEWRSCFALIYRDVLGSGSSGRVDVFNGNYGLSRGLAVAFLSMAVLACLLRPEGHWQIAASLCAIAAIISTTRMVRFGIHFSREVLYRFILLPDSR